MRKKINEINEINRTLADIKRMEAERKKLEPTVVKKAKAYKKAIHITFMVTAVFCLAILISKVVSIATHQADLPLTLTLAMIVAMTVGDILLAALIVAKSVWKRRLRKCGLFIPLEYD